MALYSHSKIQTFEQCKLKYKFKYIDKIKPEFEQSIEAHLGSCIHNTLEKLYNQVLKNKILSLDETIEIYLREWQKKFTNEIRIIKDNLTEKDYLEKGIKFLVDYYTKHYPFDDGTLELEKKIEISLSPNSEHKLIGYIDRLVFNKEKQQYEIHDYKTANSLPNKDKFENDKQLALYALGIKQLHGEHYPVLLTWHYLSYNLRIDSTRTNAQLENLKEEVIKKIEEIESTEEFSPQKSILCDWCEYKNFCPLWEKKSNFENPFD